MKGLCMKYFVLNPNKDTVYGRASRAALLAYADVIEMENKELADDLRRWVSEIKHDGNATRPRLFSW